MSSSTSTSKEFSLLEISSHNKSGDLWVAIHGFVYDISNFEDHPGGFDILLENAGTDCSQIFDDIGHSGIAHEMLPNFKIGSLKSEKSKNNLKLPSNTPSLLNSSSMSSKTTTYVYVSCALICLLLSIFIYYN